MTVEAITIVAIVVLILFILAEQPIWIGLATAGGVGLLLLSGTDVTVTSLGMTPMAATGEYVLVVIPMFILMGVLTQRSGIAEDIFALATLITRRLPGGLGIATIVACGGFAAVTGSSVATVATIGRIAIDLMFKRGYRPNTAAALVALGGTLGVLIPPSVVLIVYASLTGESVGRLLLAGVIPGVLSIVAYSVMVVILYYRGTLTVESGAHELALHTSSRDEDTPRQAVPDADAASPGRPQGALLDPTPSKITRRNLAGGAYAVTLFLIVVGGIYAGLFTATESAAIAAAVALAILLFRRRRVNARGIAAIVKNSMIETASTSSMIFALLAGAGIFSFFLVKTGLPNRIASTIASHGLPPIAIMLVTLGLMMVLGFFLDGYSILLITVPLVYPIMAGVGIDGVWFGILAVKAIEIGLITPPFGVNVFVASGSSPRVTVEGIFRAVLPMVVADLVVIGILVAVPQLVTWLPGVAYG